MDPNPNVIERLSLLSNLIAQVDETKLYWEQRLGLFWEHPPALDPEVVGQAMQETRDRIRDLEAQKSALVQQQQALIVQAAIDRANRGGD
ncbi:hypothetical protein DCAR_0100169 [Daucus carota subsp. sativus]|uniref:Uncharacterized protein n=1 Tax=Daucus carota subsp. sativus TaxID=79200 RepID=A0AAF0W1H7_DAUCS|nr:hypothetical protein DCAR_0100163 [Daucus carota subsp. sativus]WOG81024.1 hypothetical protein DCAR_0100169 [Daucus carota subsp. sativus]